MRSLRILLTILALLGLLLLGLVTSLWAWVTPERVRLQVTEAVRSNLGLSIVMENPTALRRLPALAFTVPSGLLCPPGESDPAVCARFERIDVRMNPFAVFAPSPRLTSVNIVGLHAAFTHAGAAERFFQTLGSGGWNIDRMTWQGAHVTVSGKSPVTLQGLDLTMNELSETGASAAWRTQVTAEGLTADVSGSGFFDWSTPARGLVLTNLLAEARGLWKTHEWSGTFSAEEAQWTTRTANARNASAQMRSANGETLRLTLPSITVADGRWTAPQAHASLTADTAEGRWDGTLTADLSTGEALTFDNLTLGTRFVGKNAAESPMSELRGRIRLPASDAEGEIALEGVFFDSPATVSGRILPGSAADAAPRPLVLAEVKTGVLRVGALSGFLWRPDLLRRFDLRGRITVDGLAEVPVVRALRADVELTHGVLGLPGIQADMLGGSADIAAHVEADGAWRAALRLRNARAEAAFPSGAAAPITGKLAADAALAGNLSAAKRVSQIDGSFRVEEGSFAGMDLAGLRAALLTDQPDRAPSALLQPESTSAFTALSATFSKMDEEPLLISGGKLTAKGWSADVTGEETDGRWSARLTIAVHPEGDEPGFPLPALAVWSAGAPQWSLDWPSALAAVHDVKGEPPLTVESVVRSAKRAAEDFWNSLGTESWSLPEWKMPEWEMPMWELPDWVPFGKDEKSSPSKTPAPGAL